MAPVDRDRLRPRIQHVRERLRRLREIAAEGSDAFAGDVVRQDAAVRNLQTSVEALLDMANHIVAREGLGIPTSYQEAVDLLVDHGVLPAENAESYRQMVRFRSRAVHIYDEIDVDEVYSILDSDLSDFETFIAAIVKRYFKESW